MVRQLVRTDREKLDLETVRDALRTDPIKDQADHGRVGGMLAGRIGENKYVVEYATDCRAKCKLFSCKRSLFLGELRIGKVPPRVNPLQNKRVHWYHPSCVFQSFRRASKKTKLIDRPEKDLEGWHALQPNDRAFIDLCLRRSREAPGDWALDEDTSSSNAPPGRWTAPPWICYCLFRRQGRGGGGAPAAPRPPTYAPPVPRPSGRGRTPRRATRRPTAPRRRSLPARRLRRPWWRRSQRTSAARASTRRRPRRSAGGRRPGAAAATTTPVYAAAAGLPRRGGLQRRRLRRGGGRGPAHAAAAAPARPPRAAPRARGRGRAPPTVRRRARSCRAAAAAWRLRCCGRCRLGRRRIWRLQVARQTPPARFRRRHRARLWRGRSVGPGAPATAHLPPPAPPSSVPPALSAAGPRRSDRLCWWPPRPRRRRRS